MTPSLHTEPLLNLGALSRRVHGRGRHEHVSPRSLSRWILKGSRTAGGERIYLEAVRTPAGWQSSEAALFRFLDSLTTASRPEATQQPPRTPAARTRSSEAAEATLKDLGA
ncbi:unnamed protein product [Gemmataceae bacterium]|nr:unnamed protein product [Gemmataceae bacterium]VTU01424.1 unnamed protein product [Gemmataceae bacterium]